MAGNGICPPFYSNPNYIWSPDVWGGGLFHPLLLCYWLVQFEGTPGLGLAERCLPFCWLPPSGALQDQVMPMCFEPDTSSPETCLGCFRVAFTAKSEANIMLLWSELVMHAVGTDQFSSLVSPIKPNSLSFPHLHSGNDDTYWTGLW